MSRDADSYPMDEGQPEENTLRVRNRGLRAGFTLIPTHVLRARNLSRDAKLLYGILLSYAWQKGSCFPGYDTLRGDLQCGRNQLSRAIQELKREGFITVQRRGQGKTSIYTIEDGPEDFQKYQSGTSRSTKVVPPKVSERYGEQDTVEEDSEEEHVGVVTQGALVKFGISEGAAAKLAATYPEPYILAKLDLVQWLVEARSPLVGKNPAGYLRRAIEEDYTAPPKYKSPAHRQAEVAARDQAEHDEQERRREAEADYARAKVVDQQKLAEHYPPQPIPGTTQTTQEVWERTLDELHAQVTRPNFEMWLKPTTLVLCDGQRAVIAAPSRYHADTLAGRLTPLVQHALSTVLGTPVQCQYVPIPDLLEAGEHSENGRTPPDVRYPTGHGTAAGARPRPGGVSA